MNVAEKQRVLEQMVEVLEYVEICDTKLKAIKADSSRFYQVFGTIKERNHEIEITTKAMHRFAERYAKLKKLI